MTATPTDFMALRAEEMRLAKLQSYPHIEHYRLSGTFQHIARMASHIFSVPIAVVNFVGSTSVQAAAIVGIEGMEQIDRSISLCSLAIEQDEVLVFENASYEPCLISNPLVHGKLGIQFYAGAPLISPEGYRVGVVAVADKLPRNFSDSDRRTLESLASLVMEELEDGRV